MIVAWKTRNTSRLINTTRQAPTVDSGQSTVLTYARRIAGHTDYIADVLLLLPDSTSWAFMPVGTSLEITLLRKTASSIKFQGILGEFDADCPLDGPNMGRAVVAFDGTKDPVLTT